MPPLPVKALPVQDLGYSHTYSAPGRPGVVTAMGVISIVVGGLGILGNIFAGMYAIMFCFMAAMGPTMLRGARFGDSVGPAEQTWLVNAMVQSQARARSPVSQPFTAQRQQVVQKLLTDHGELVFPSRSPSSAVANAQILSSGSYINSGDPSRSFIHFFMTPTGRLDVGDDFAGFYPQGLDPSKTTAPPAGLSATQVGAAMGALKPLAQTPLSPEETAVVRRELANPYQNLIGPLDDPRTQLTGLPDSAGGGKILHAAGGAIFYLPPASGAQVGEDEGISNGGPSPAAGSSTTAPATGGGPAGSTKGPPAKWQMSMTAAVLTVIEAIASFGLAIYLLVVGILVFRFSRRGRWQHLVYAFLKPPLVLLCCISWYIAMTGMVASFASVGAATGRPNPMAGAAQGFLVMCIGWAVISSLYPIALIVTVHSRTVRDYYQNMGT
jgi:hypothetical protein